MTALRVQENVPLRDLTTLKIGGSARYFCSVTTAKELREAIRFAREKNVPFFMLGGGSNILVADSGLGALVVKIALKGIVWESPLIKGALPSSAGGLLQPPAHRNASPPFSKGDSVLAIAGAGENWDALVAKSVQRGLWGIENLSGIPGTVGAAPVQNIGAYGAEIKDVLQWLEAFDPEKGEVQRLSRDACGFGYRDSIFKKPEGKHLIITRVALRLKQNGRPNLGYKDLQERFKIQDSRFKKEDITPTQMRNAVLEIRSKKFPDLGKCGTAGSFFKNPIIPREQFEELKKKFPDLPGFELRIRDKGLKIKVSLAWILDNVCNLKGFRRGNVALFEDQPLVLINTGGATAEEIKDFADEIARRVKETTGISIEYEVQTLV